MAMNTRRRFAAAVVLALPYWYAAAQESAITYDPSFTCRGGPLGLRLPATYQAVRSIGKLEREEVTGVQDWKTYKSEDRELVFGGLTLHVVTFTNDKSRYMVSGAVITGSQWTLGGGIRIGNPVAEVLRRAGKGVLKDGAIAIGGDTDTVTFHAPDGKVTQITYECYTG
jgi:hypothetical protein